METLHLLGLKATHRFWYELFNYFFVIHVTSNCTSMCKPAIIMVCLIIDAHAVDFESIIRYS